jgi:hypothetical protein
MKIRRRINGGEWEELDVEFGVLEDDDFEGEEVDYCLYCSLLAHPGQNTCGRAACVGKDIARQAGLTDG